VIKETDTVAGVMDLAVWFLLPAEPVTDFLPLLLGFHLMLRGNFSVDFWRSHLQVYTSTGRFSQSGVHSLGPVNNACSWNTLPESIKEVRTWK
jgi:hypothetical protein